MSWFRWVAGAAAVPFGIGTEIVAGAWGSPLGTVDLAVGLAYVWLGLLMGEPRGRRTGLLMTATGFAWLTGNIATPLLLLHRGPLVHLLVGHPRGRLRDVPARIVVGAAYLTAVAYPLGANSWVAASLCAAVLGTVVVGFLRSSRPVRRTRVVGLVGVVSVMAVLGLAAGLRIAGVEAENVVLWAYQLVLLGVAALVFVDYRWGPWRGSTVTGLALDLGEIEHGGALQAKLAMALGDPSVQLVYWVAEAGGYVDIAGRSVDEPARDDPNRVLTVLEHNGTRLGALVHDASVADDDALAADIVSLARTALENARLQSELRMGLTEVEASRRRIVEAADAERRRLEHQLREGAEQRLLAAEELIDASGAEHADLRELVARSLADLEAFARGVHPQALTRFGLGAALAELAEVTPLRVQLDVVDERFPPDVEAAAYFVCSEALANTTKHAGATTVRVLIATRGAGVVIEVVDDGVGGAQLDRGSGLRGLADRAAALGGELRVDTTAAGTRVFCTIPT